MADPIRYSPEYSFADYQANLPNKPLPGQKVDQELMDIEASLDSAIDAIRDIRRSDGKLQNGIVTANALSSEVSAGVQPAVEWATATQYGVGATVFNSTAFYRALETHVSGVFNDDLADGLWELYADFGPIVTGAAASAAAAAESASDASDSADEAANSASAASASASAAAGSASAASDSADAAAASALEAANVVGDGTGAVRWDVAQSLASGEQLQARENLGVTANGSTIVTTATSAGVTLATAANAAAQRTALGATTVGGNLFTAADAAAGRSAISAEVITQAASGVGQIVALVAAPAAALVLPSGGTWEYWGVQWASGSGNLNGDCYGGVAAGGTTVKSAVAGTGYHCRAKRIA